MDTDMYYNNYFLRQHDLLRELAILQSSQEPFEQRERLMIDLTGNNPPEWCVGQNQQGIIFRMLSFFPIRWMEPKQKQVATRILSISTGLFSLSLSIYILYMCVRARACEHVHTDCFYV